MLTDSSITVSLFKVLTLKLGWNDNINVKLCTVSKPLKVIFNFTHINPIVLLCTINDWHINPITRWYGLETKLIKRMVHTVHQTDLFSNSLSTWDDLCVNMCKKETMFKITIYIFSSPMNSEPYEEKGFSIWYSSLWPCPETNPNP
jgi:hypothetical protein